MSEENKNASNILSNKLESHVRDKDGNKASNTRNWNKDDSQDQRQLSGSSMGLAHAAPENGEEARHPGRVALAHSGEGAKATQQYPEGRASDAKCSTFGGIS